MDASEILETVSATYDMYFERREEDNLVKIGDEEPSELNRRAIQEGSGNVFNIVTEADQEYLIVFNGDIPQFHEMPYEFLLEYPIELTRLMRIRPITLDHRHYWSWTTHFLSYMDRVEPVLGSQLSQSIQSLIQLLLVLNSPLDENKLNRIANLAMSKHLSAVKQNSLPIAAFSSYPVLEGILKRICDDVIKPNGEIRQGKRLHGVGHDYVADDQCSSLKDLCYHTENHVVESHVRSKISELRDQIVLFGDKDNAYELIYDWRNSLLHGQGTYDIQAGIVANFICMLVWNEIGENRFEEQKDDIIEDLKQSQRMPDMGMGMGMRMDIYPPE